MQAPNMNRIQSVLSEARDDELEVLAANPDLNPGIKNAIEGERKRRREMSVGDTKQSTPKMAKGGLMDPAVVQEDGNVEPVPPGALPEEVADDVDVKLSNGEVVIPADVVRWHGLKTFEAMRAQAKKGLMSMDAEGRIQTPPADTVVESPTRAQEGPLDDMTMAEGGLVTKPPVAASNSPQPASPQWGSRIGSQGPGTTDFIDTDNNGVDDRYERAPNERGPSTATNPTTKGGLASAPQDMYADTYNQANPATPVVAGIDQFGRKAYAYADRQGQGIMGPTVVANKWTPNPALAPNSSGLAGPTSGDGQNQTNSSNNSTLNQVLQVGRGVAITALGTAGVNALFDAIDGMPLGEALNKNFVDPVTGAVKKVGEWLGINSPPAGTANQVVSRTAVPDLDGPLPNQGTVTGQQNLPGGAGADAIRPGVGTNPLGGQATTDLLGRTGWQFTDTGNAFVNTGINIGLDIAGGYLGNKLSGMFTERTGQSWGSAIGGAAASTFGGTAAALTGISALAMPGVGALVGAFVGGLIGGQFGAKPSVGANVAVGVNNFKDPNSDWDSGAISDSDKFGVGDARKDNSASDDLVNVVKGMGEAAGDAAKDLITQFGGKMSYRTGYRLEFIANPNREKDPNGPGQFRIWSPATDGSGMRVVYAVTADEKGALQAVNTLTGYMVKDSGVLDSVSDASKKQQLQTAITQNNVLSLINRPANTNTTQQTSQQGQTTAPTTTPPPTSNPTQTPAPTQQTQRPAFDQRTNINEGIMTRPNVNRQPQQQQQTNTAAPTTDYQRNLQQYQGLMNPG